MLVGRRIGLKTPEVILYPFSKLRDVFADITTKQSVIVHQSFIGMMGGDVLLLLTADSASVFIDLLSGGVSRPQQLSASDREALLEVGNILLNA